MSPGLIAAAIVVPLVVLTGAITGYILWRRGVHARLRVKAGSWLGRRYRSKRALGESALPPLTPFPATPGPNHSPSPRGEKTRRSINVESCDNPFEDPPTSFDLENRPPLAPVGTLDVYRDDDELPRATSSARSSATVQTVRQVRIQDQIDTMRAQIQWLLYQQQSDWALGLTDEPPPRYRQSDGSRIAVTQIEA
jgi:hypothetical protein